MCKLCHYCWSGLVAAVAVAVAVAAAAVVTDKITSAMNSLNDNYKYFYFGAYVTTTYCDHSLICMLEILLLTYSCIVLFAIFSSSFCFVTLADEASMKAALALSGGSLKGSTLSIDVSKRHLRASRPEASSSRGGFASPRGRGGGYQSGNNRGELVCSTDQCLYLQLLCFGLMRITIRLKYWMYTCR